MLLGSGLYLFTVLISVVSTVALVFVAIGVARAAKALVSMNITTMDILETAKRIEKAQQSGK